MRESGISNNCFRSYFADTRLFLSYSFSVNRPQLTYQLCSDSRGYVELRLHELGSERRKTADYHSCNNVKIRKVNKTSDHFILF